MQARTAFDDLSTAILNDACLRLGVAYGLAPPGIASIVPGSRVAGRVLPVRHTGQAEIFFEAIEAARPGDVMVIDNDGRLDEGCIGDLVAVEARAAGIEGFVIWGSYRDKVELRALGVPVFAYGTFPRGPVEGRTVPTDRLERAHLGSITTERGDLVFADDDGALFVAESDFANVVRVAQQIRARERQQCDLVARGTTLRAQFAFAEFLERRAKDHSYTFSQHVRETGGAFGE